MGGGELSNSYFKTLKEITKKLGISLFGINWEEFENLIDYEQPTNYIVKSANYNDKFNIPVLTAGQTFILGYTKEQDGVYNASKANPVIIFDDFTASNHWVDFSFKVKSSAIKILKPKDMINFRYCYYHMQNININITEHKRLWISKYSQIKIPIPSLKVQEYIVFILDKFDAIINDVSQGLPKEIELRKKQYEYYREKLLSFSKNN